jgi:hypothetical protein
VEYSGEIFLHLECRYALDGLVELVSVWKEVAGLSTCLYGLVGMCLGFVVEGLLEIIARTVGDELLDGDYFEYFVLSKEMLTFYGRVGKNEFLGEQMLKHYDLELSVVTMVKELDVVTGKKYSVESEVQCQVLEMEVEIL